MSAFLEEYGKVIVIVIVIAAMIVMVAYFKDSGSKSVKEGFGLFVNVGENSSEEAVGEAGDAVSASTD